MTESRLHAENKELKERLREMAGYGTANVLLKKQVEDLIKENQRLVDTIFEKQAMIDDLNNWISQLYTNIDELKKTE